MAIARACVRACERVRACPRRSVRLTARRSPRSPPPLLLLRADALIAHLEPIQARYNALALEPEYLKEVLTDGADAASAVADQTLLWAKEAMGITQPGGVPILSAMPAPPKSRAAA
jgi:hypothetical protein